MPVNRQDQIKLCNDHGVPLEDFRLQFCARCLQPECTRSQHGKSRFDQRVVTWESRLFVDVPRMSPSDPRIKNIQAQKFIQIDTGRPHEVQGWVDPRDVSEEPSTPDESVCEAPETKSVETQTTVDPDEQSSERLEDSPALKNTPNRRGQMLGGKNVGPAKPVSDPWKPKEPTKGKIVQPGAKIRLGGS